MANPNILALVGAVAIAAVVGAVVEAANRQTRSHSQCHRQATSLGNNPNDELDRWSYDNVMARCMYGTDAETAVRIEHRMATRGDREYRREQQVAQRRRPEIDRRVLAQAEVKYRPYGVRNFDFCRDLGAVRAERFSDEAGNGNQFMADCLAGKIPR